MIAPRGNDMTDISSDSRLQAMSMDNDEDTVNSGDNGIQELLDWNGFTYVFPQTNSVVSARNLKMYPSISNEYANNSQIEFRLGTGSQYVDFRRSAISFKLEVTVSVNADNRTATSGDVGFWPTFGSGSIFNLFDALVVSSRSGAELQRIEKLGLYRVSKDYLVRDKHWFDTAGSSLFYTPLSERGDLIETTKPHSPFTSSDADVGKLLYANTTATKVFTTDVIIPLYLFDGLFNVDQLCPSFLASGMRIELRMADPKTSMCVQWKSLSGDVNYGTATKWAPTQGTDTLNVTACTTKISDAKIIADTHILNESSTYELKRVSAQNGLEYTYKGIHYQPEPMTSTQVNASLTRAVSRALNMFVIQSRTFGTSPTIDYYRCGTNNVTKFQARLGSQYYPHAPFTNQSQLFWNALYAYDQLDSTPSLSLNDYKTKSKALVASFERSSLLRFSGAPLNNSRAMSFDITFDAVTDTQIHCFLEYVQLAKTYLNNVVVTM